MHINKFNQYLIGITLFLIFQFSFGQERIISEVVIGQNLTEFPGVVIMTLNNKIVDTTDSHGRFEFQHYEEIEKIKFVSLATQEEIVEIATGCDYIELILLEEWIYDFINLNKARRKKRRDRKRILPKLYNEAYEKGIFKKEKTCG